MDAPNPHTFPREGDIGKILLNEETIQNRVAELGAQISADYQGRKPLLISILKGSVVFVADLLRAIDAPVEIDFMAVSSYGSGTKSSGAVKIVKDLDRAVSGRDVVLVEDIIDSGLTARYLLNYFRSQNAASLQICTLLLRDDPDREPIDIKYVGFELPPAFVIGYGLDVDQEYRNLPYIAEYARA